MPKRILMIDDEVHYISNHVEYLELLDFKVRVVEYVDEAYKLLKQGEFDLLITDLMMPERRLENLEGVDVEKTGVRLIIDVRTKLKLDIPIIVMSVVRNSDKLSEIFQNEDVRNNVYHCKKPVSLHELKRSVEKALG